ncbi:hypothetical protein HDU67_008375 [Dinochytrium kinnereticum]|nr:hypothetical protein HDU67_008375 [Dinochytrium kinnereticum]
MPSLTLAPLPASPLVTAAPSPPPPPFFLVKSQLFNGCMSADIVSGRITFSRSCSSQFFFIVPTHSGYDPSTTSTSSTSTTTESPNTSPMETTTSLKTTEDRELDGLSIVDGLIKTTEMGVWFRTRSIREDIGDCLAINRGNVIMLQKGCPYVDPPHRNTSLAGVPSELMQFAYREDGTIQNGGGLCIEAASANFRTFANAA